MNSRIRNSLVVFSGIAIGRLGSYLWMNQPKALVLPKDVSAAMREANRRIAFSGARNFRDLGGYVTLDGSTVKWGVLYRSDNLAKMTNQDLEYFSALGLYRLIDFRADYEKAEEPDHLPANPGFEVVELPIFDSNSKLGPGLRQRIMAGNLDGVDPDALLMDGNAQFATEFTPQFRAFAQEVWAAQGKPVLFHCTAGKDRTGFAAAILLRILGVPQQIVLQDYLLSQAYILDAYSKNIMVLRLTKGEKIARLVEKLFGVNAAYLQAAFDTIDARYGSFAAYVSDGLGLSAADVAVLRSNLLA